MTQYGEDDNRVAQVVQAFKPGFEDFSNLWGFLRIFVVSKGENEASHRRWKGCPQSSVLSYQSSTINPQSSFLIHWASVLSPQWSVLSWWLNKDIHLQLCCFLLAGSNKLCKCGNQQKEENTAFMLQKCPKTMFLLTTTWFRAFKSQMSQKSQHTHYVDKMQDQVSFWGFPATCAILLPSECKGYTETFLAVVPSPKVWHTCFWTSPSTTIW